MQKVHELPDGTISPMGCECGKTGEWVAYSHRLECVVCWDCYQRSPEARATAECVERQHEVACAISAAAAYIDDRRRRRMVEDRALLIALASNGDEVAELLDEVERLGIRREVGR